MGATISLGRGRDRVEGEFSIERWIALHDMISTIQSWGAGYPPRDRVGMSAGRSGSPPRIAPRTTPPAQTAARSPPRCQMRLPFQHGRGKVSALRDGSPLGWVRRRATPSILILLRSPSARRGSAKRGACPGGAGAKVGPSSFGLPSHRTRRSSCPYLAVDAFSHTPDVHRHAVHFFLLLKRLVFSEPLLAIEYHEVSLRARAPIHVLRSLLQTGPDGPLQPPSQYLALDHDALLPQSCAAM